MTKKFVLVSLQEKKAKKLAEVISNNTCRKILDYMASKKDVTESELSKHLKIPLSTVHYNMKALMKAKLAKSDEYHYSEKGKEVSHYRLANQYVIIAPEEDKKLLREKLKSILPITLVAGAAASIIKLFSGTYFGVSKMSADSAVFAKTTSGVGGAVAPAIPQAAPLASRAAPMMAEEAAPEMAKAAVDVGADAAMGEATNVAYDVAVEEAGQELVKESANEVASVAVDDGAREVLHHATEPIIPPPSPEPSIFNYLHVHIYEILVWFIIGALIGLGIYYLASYIKKKRRKRIEIKVKPPKK